MRIAGATVRGRSRLALGQYRGPVRERLRWEAKVPLARHLGTEFIRQIAWHVGLALKAPNPYDCHHGAPLLVERRTDERDE